MKYSFKIIETYSKSVRSMLMASALTDILSSRLKLAVQSTTISS